MSNPRRQGRTSARGTNGTDDCTSGRDAAAPRRDTSAATAGGAQTGAGGAATPLAPTADASTPNSTAPTSADATTSACAPKASAGTVTRRAVALAILRTLPTAVRAAVLATFVTWLRAILAAVDAVRDGMEPRAAAAFADHAAEHIAHTRWGGALDVGYHVYALAGVWLYSSPEEVRRVMEADDDGRVYVATCAIEALDDIEALRHELAARAELLPRTVEGEGASPPSTGGPSTRDRGALRELLCDAARLFDAAGSTHGEDGQLAAALVRITSGRATGDALVYLGASLAGVAVGNFDAAELRGGLDADSLARALAACELSARCASMVRALVPGLASGLDAPPVEAPPVDLDALDAPLDPWGPW